MTQQILMMLVRRLIGYAGVAGVAGLDNDLVQLGGAVAAVGSLAWSIYGKIKAARVSS